MKGIDLQSKKIRLLAILICLALVYFFNSSSNGIELDPVKMFVAFAIVWVLSTCLFHCRKIKMLLLLAIASAINAGIIVLINKFNKGLAITYAVLLTYIYIEFLFESDTQKFLCAYL